MLRNLLHFSELDADDVAIPRGEIVAVEASRVGTSWSPPSPSTAIRGMPVYRDQLDQVVGMIMSRSVPFLARGARRPRTGRR